MLRVTAVLLLALLAACSSPTTPCSPTGVGATATGRLFTVCANGDTLFAR